MCEFSRKPSFFSNLFDHLIYPLTARVVGAPHMILQPVPKLRTTEKQKEKKKEKNNHITCQFHAGMLAEGREDFRSFHDCY